jgi:hypothetical protein
MVRPDRDRIGGNPRVMSISTSHGSAVGHAARAAVSMIRPWLSQLSKFANASRERQRRAAPQRPVYRRLRAGSFGKIALRVCRSGGRARSRGGDGRLGAATRRSRIAVIVISRSRRRRSQHSPGFLPISDLIFSNRKSWLRGCHHGVGPQHLQAFYVQSASSMEARYDVQRG